LWNTFANTQCPVSGGRGANAAADFAANKTIGIVPLYGTMLIGNDLGSGVLSGVPVISGSITTNGSYIGEVLHTITVGQLPPHTHGYSGSGTTAIESANHQHPETTFMQSSGVTGPGSGGPAFLGNNVASQFTGSENTTHTHSFSWSGTTDNGTGGGAAENNTPRAMVGYWIIKL
jgi:microcystin-dependent protein